MSIQACSHHAIKLLFLYRFGYAFLWDSGSSVGKIDQHGKSINAIDFKPTRPYRVCTASEDFTCNLYEGPPFKYKKAERVCITSYMYICYKGGKKLKLAKR